MNINNCRFTVARYLWSACVGGVVEVGGGVRVEVGGGELKGNMNEYHEICYL